MCLKRVKGCLGVSTILGIDMIVVYYFFGLYAALISTIVMILYVFFVGEWIDIHFLKHGIPLKQLSGMEAIKLKACSEKVAGQAREKYNLKWFSPKFYMIPDNMEINAYAFGHMYIGVNQAALQMDQGVLQAIISHEVGHILYLDATINRILFINLLAVAGIFLASQYIILACIIAMFLILSLCGMFNSLIQIYLISGLVKGIKKIANGIGHILLAVYQAFNCFRSRKSEYAADRCSCELGYSVQLTYFLKRFAANPRYADNLIEALYDTHPLPQKRIVKIQQFEQKRTELSMRNN